jgi:hypothetical protein
MKPIEKVFLPIANLYKNKPVDFLLFYLPEAENATDFQLIDTVAKLISNKVLQLIHNNVAVCCCCFLSIISRIIVPNRKRNM